MLKKMILIKRCPDGSMWYSSFVGYCVPYLSQESDCFMSLEPSGFTNIIKKSDGELVEVNVNEAKEFRVTIVSRDVVNVKASSKNEAIDTAMSIPGAIRVDEVEEL